MRNISILGWQKFCSWNPFLQVVFFVSDPNLGIIFHYPCIHIHGKRNPLAWQDGGHFSEALLSLSPHLGSGADDGLSHLLQRLQRLSPPHSGSLRSAPLLEGGFTLSTHSYTLVILDLFFGGLMKDIQTAESSPHKCRHLAPFKEGKFGEVGSNRNSQTRHVSNYTTNSWSECLWLELQLLTNQSWPIPNALSI